MSFAPWAGILWHNAHLTGLVYRSFVKPKGANLNWRQSMNAKNILFAILALSVGAAAGWFAAGVGRARCPQRAVDGGLGQTAPPVHRNGQDARCPSKLSQPRRWSASSEAGRSRCAPHSESPAIRRSSNSAWVHSESGFGCRILVGNARPNCGIIWPRRKLCL